MKRTFTFLLLVVLAGSLLAQVPQKFSYQAVVRNATGQTMENKAVRFRLSLLEDSVTGNVLYSETHQATTSSLGIVNLLVGDGNEPSGNFSSIPWDKPIYLQVEIDPAGGTSYVDMGVSQIVSVPYALRAGNLAKGAVDVAPGADHNPDDPLFVVRNSEGQIVFAVYEDGARFNVGDRTRSRRGGFAIGGLVNQTKDGKDEVDYFSLQPDSIRFNLQMDDSKSRRGGFAIGGLVNQTKGTTVDYLTLRPDSIRFAIDESMLDKSRRGGFAIGGLVNQTKDFRNYLVVSRDTTYVTNTLATEGNVQIAGDVAIGGDVTSTDIKDGDGNAYPTIRIGNQVWMAKNLRTTRYNDGTPIVNNNPTLDIDNPYVSVSDDENLAVDPWGYLYLLKAINYTDRNICPVGYRLPTMEDWYELIETIGWNFDRLLDPTPDLWPPHNKKGRAAGEGFNALPAGEREFFNMLWEDNTELRQAATFWSQPLDQGDGLSSEAFRLSINPDNYLEWGTNWQGFEEGYEDFNAFSVRCIKD